MLDRFMGTLAGCATPEAAFGAFISASHELGFNACSYADLSLLAQPELYAERLRPTFGLPVEWGLRYARQSYHRLDPVLLACRASRAPLVWSKFKDHAPLRRPQRRFMEEAWEFGLREGLSFTIGGGQGELIAVTYVTDEARAVSPADALTARSAATIFHLVHDQLQQAGTESAGPGAAFSEVTERRPVLSVREQQCLEWVCRGKSSWVIAEILGLRPKTVDHYLANASRKLEASSRVAAAVRAVQLGLIQP